MFNSMQYSTRHPPPLHLQCNVQFNAIIQHVYTKCLHNYIGEITNLVLKQYTETILFYQRPTEYTVCLG